MAKTTPCFSVSVSEPKRKRVPSLVKARSWMKKAPTASIGVARTGGA
jgi:hypothetical protein